MPIHQHQHVNIQKQYQIILSELTAFQNACRDFDDTHPLYLFRVNTLRAAYKILGIVLVLTFKRKSKKQSQPNLVIAGRFYARFLHPKKKEFERFGSMIFKHEPVHLFSCYLSKRLPALQGEKLNLYHQATVRHEVYERNHIAGKMTIIFLTVITAIAQGFSAPIASALGIEVEEFKREALILSVIGLGTMLIFSIMEGLVNTALMRRKNKAKFEDAVFLYLSFLKP